MDAVSTEYSQCMREQLLSEWASIRLTNRARASVFSWEFSDDLATTGAEVINMPKINKHHAERNLDYEEKARWVTQLWNAYKVSRCNAGVCNYFY
jgi:hypothetical protein